MRAELWKKIDELFDAAKKQSADERAAFLDRACRGDGELRAEVESLLRAAGKAETFLEHSPAAASEEQPSLKRGDKLGVFEIVERIGRGGMGAVYRAYDTRLRRQVALKVLPPEHLTDPESKQRLLHEARAASALNHPNIVTVHEIGSENSMDFIAMELVEGKSLTELIPAKGLPLKEALDYAVQIAGGLAKAHAVGIIHRDVKPGNIMVTPDGVVKLLDFGLARRVQRAESETASLTQEGEIAGTPAYMSPEQVRGEELDARTDLFSFGAVLYEMVTGRAAFSGTTSALIFDAILHQAPTAPVQLNAKCPPELERILNKALEKGLDLRFQTAADLCTDLKRLKHDTDSGRVAAALSERQFPVPVADRRHRWRRLVALATIAVAVIVLGVGGLLWFSRSRPVAPEAGLKAVPLTTFLGTQTDPTFSPDGSQIAFRWNGEKAGKFNIYVKLIGSEPPLRLTNNPADEYSPVWSPDGRWIAFCRDLSEGKYAIVLTSPIPGPERILTESYRDARDELSDRLLSWSPDSRWLAMTMKGSEKPQELPTIFLFSLEAGEKRKITSRPVGNWVGDSCPAFSPDGRKLAFSRWAAWASSEIYVLDLSLDLKPIGEPKRVTFGNWVAITPAWVSDGKSLIFSANLGAERYLWRLDVPGSSQPQRLAALGDRTIEPAISRRGNRLAYAQFTGHAAIGRIEISPAAGKTKLPEKFIYSTRNDNLPQFSPDGKKVAFLSDRSGTGEVWICDADGSNLVQLTSFETSTISILAWSPDSSRLAFSANIEGRAEVYVMSASGGSPRRLTIHPLRSEPGLVERRTLDSLRRRRTDQITA